MKYGYSILLSEHIQAGQITYDDCKAFQVVCPCCKEPIFKVIRGEESAEPAHYLSHYEKAASFAADCELRVNSITASDVAHSNQTSRDQRLQYFLTVLQETVLKNEYRGDAGRSVGILKQLAKSNAIRCIRDRLHAFATSSSEHSQQQRVYELFDGYIKEIESIAGGFPKTAFSILTQKKIAYDMWLHLLSPNARQSFDFMFNNSYLFLISRIERTRNAHELSEYEHRLHADMLHLMRKPKDQGMRTISEMLQYKVAPPHSLGLDLMSKMLSEIQHEIYGCLLRVPYFELLKSAVTRPM